MRHIVNVLGIDLAPYKEGQIVFSMRCGAGVITKIHYDAEGITYMEVTFFYALPFNQFECSPYCKYLDNGMPWEKYMGIIDLHDIIIPESNLNKIADKWNEFKEALHKWNIDVEFVRRNIKGIMKEYGIHEEKKEDLTNPSYYNVEGASQPIEDMEALMTPEQFEGFLWGNIIKYAKRFGRKGDKILTLGKIIWYAERLKKQLEKESGANGHD